jgi:outer membrane biosynthesis protein TonB
MPILEIPPNSTESETTPTEPQTAPKKVMTRRFGELEEHELLHLLDSIDDEIAKARFRESIYVSIIFCLALAWLLFYGPRVLFHQGRIVSPKENVTELHEKPLPMLDLPKSLVHKTPPRPKALSQQDQVAQTAHPVPQPAEPVRGAPAPQQPTPQPQQQAQQQPQPRPQPQNTPLPDAPHAAPSQQAANHPNFPSAKSPSQAMHDLAAAAARGAGGNYGTAPPGRHSGINTGVEILSDTQGVNLEPYIKRLLRILYNNWIPLIPEETLPPLNKEGQTLIRFTINPDGTLAVGGMHLDASTHDQAIDRAAWGAITSSDPLPPLPKEFKGSNLELRIDFIISKNAQPNDF